MTLSRRPCVAPAFGAIAIAIAIVSAVMIAGCGDPKVELVPVPVPDAKAAAAWLGAQGVRNAERWLAFAGGAPLRALEYATGERGEAIERVLGKPAKRETLPPQAGDLPRTWASIALAAAELGFAPRVDLDECIAIFVRWLREEAECGSS